MINKGNPRSSSGIQFNKNNKTCQASRKPGDKGRLSVKGIHMTVERFLVLVPGDGETLPLLTNESFVAVGP